MISDLGEKLFQKRWIIGGILILLFTILEIHGSSISFYADLLGHPELSDILCGKYRAVRSDEWVVFTPFAFSQYFTNFSLISDIVRAAPTNMFMTYGQAAWHPAIIFRPAQIGYLFLDAGSALAFFWTSRLIILFLVSFEFARLILQVDKKFSVIYAIMIAFSPLAQWWWSINSIAEILAAGQGVAVCWKLYFEQAESRKRFLFIAGFLYCAGVFIFGIYPAWQVTFGYIFLFCLIAISFKHSSALKIFWHDKIFWIVGFFIMLAPIVHAVYTSRDMIDLQLATEYPGRRFSTGGEWSLPMTLIMSVAYGIDSVLPFKYLATEHANNTGISTFFSMAPLGWLIFFYLRFKLKCKDFLMTALFATTVLFFAWECVAFPDFFAKFSLLSMSVNMRLRPVIDFAQLLMIFRGLSLIKIFPPLFVRLILAVVIAILPVIGIKNFLPEWLDFETGAAIFFVTLISVILFLTPMNKKNFAILVALMLAMGATVNPINKGVDVIKKMPVGQKISEIVQQEKKSVWIVANDNVWVNDFPIMYGAPTINSVNVYPYFERWKKLDPDEKNFKIYNRYAHIIITLQNDEPTKFLSVQSDIFRLNLNTEDLPTLEVKYIFSQQGDLENFSTQNVTIQKIYADANSFIYKVAAN